VSAGPVEVFGPYLVYEQLGLGGMARVDRAEHTGIEGFHRSVALKRMLPHVADNLEMVQAFVREARLAGQLRHANVAQMYELGRVGEIYYITMELITGSTLRAVLKRCAQTTGPMPVPVALNILSQICDALDYAHNLCDESGQPLGIIHRDVSPSNIIVDEAGVAKLIDFGVAKASAAGMQTTSGMIKGKFAYMAPEYLVGAIDARADLFAVGVIAHELLTNQPLFAGNDDMDTLRRVRSMEIEPPSRTNPSVPPEVDDVVMTALSRDPDHRWQHATALRAALATVTRRCRLACTNQQVVEWITWASEQTRPNNAEITLGGIVTHEADPSYPSVQIELETDGPPTPPPRAPTGTPSRSIAAQPSRPPPAPHLLEHKQPRAAVPAYGRNEGLLPTPRNSDKVLTARLRPSTPRPWGPALVPTVPCAPPAEATLLELSEDEHSPEETTVLHPSDDDESAFGDATELHPSDDESAFGDATELHPGSGDD
jgi:eukaryotic-like serine/threonine-protein kinase